MINMSANSTCFLWLLFSLLLLLNLDSASLTASRACSRHCGGMHIPYPFGIGMGCYLEKWYEIKCVNTTISGKHVPFLAAIGKEVVNISLPDLLRIKNPIASKGCSSHGEESELRLNLTGTPFSVGPSNTLIAAGCDITAWLTNIEPSVVGCNSRCGKKSYTTTQSFLTLDDCIGDYGYDDMYCTETSFVDKKSCSGTGCCEAKIPDGHRQIVGVRIDNATTTGGCKVAFLTDENYLLSNGSDPQRLHSKRYATVELGFFIHISNRSFFDSLGCHNWENYTGARGNNDRRSYGIGCVCKKYSSVSSYGRCGCITGYRGNPYIPGGCKG